VAFARAGANKIVLIGRNEAPLVETQKSLECSSSVHAADVTDEKTITEIAADTGTWDVMILAAGYVAHPAPIRESSVEDWWKSFEVCDDPTDPPKIPEPYNANHTRVPD
jgi:NADP-dependent 3-hydroxy acid dehydrogenase YdfG